MYRFLDAYKKTRKLRLERNENMHGKRSECGAFLDGGSFRFPPETIEIDYDDTQRSRSKKENVKRSICFESCEPTFRFKTIENHQDPAIFLLSVESTRWPRKRFVLKKQNQSVRKIIVRIVHFFVFRSTFLLRWFTVGVRKITTPAIDIRTVDYNATYNGAHTCVVSLLMAVACAWYFNCTCTPNLKRKIYYNAYNVIINYCGGFFCFVFTSPWNRFFM